MYIKRMTFYGEIAVIISGILLFVLVGPITKLAGMEPESAALCCKLTRLLSVYKMFAWRCPSSRPMVCVPPAT